MISFWRRVLLHRALQPPRSQVYNLIIPNWKIERKRDAKQYYRPINRVKVFSAPAVYCARETVCVCIHPPLDEALMLSAITRRGRTSPVAL